MIFHEFHSALYRLQGNASFAAYLVLRRSHTFTKYSHTEFSKIDALDLVYNATNRFLLDPLILSVLGDQEMGGSFMKKTRFLVALFQEHESRNQLRIVHTVLALYTAIPHI